jgi:hypothetical protein
MKLLSMIVLTLVLLCSLSLAQTGSVVRTPPKVQAHPLQVTPAPPEDCSAGFTPGAVQLRSIGSRWVLADGNHEIYSALYFSWLAEKVLATIQFYRMDTSCFVGRPNAPFHYMKVGQGAPSGAMSGEDCTAFSPQAVAMREDNKKWKVAYGQQELFRFDTPELARQAIEIIRYYGFTHQCFVGRDPNVNNNAHVPPWTYMRK